MESAVFLLLSTSVQLRMFLEACEQVLEVLVAWFHCPVGFLNFIYLILIILLLTWNVLNGISCALGELSKKSSNNHQERLFDFLLSLIDDYLRLHKRLMGKINLLNFSFADVVSLNRYHCAQKFQLSQFQIQMSIWPMTLFSDTAEINQHEAFSYERKD